MSAALLCVFVLGLSLNAVAQSQRETIASNDPNGRPVDYATFKDPPREYWGHAWFTFVLPSLTEDRVKSMIQRAAQSDSYGGFMITPDGGFGRAPGSTAATDRPPVTYLNDEFFRLYKVAIEEGLKNNLPMDVLYDELQFPTGMAGGLFYAKYPDDVEKSLEKVEKDVAGPADAELTIPIANGIYLGSVLMNLDTFECVDVSGQVRRDGLAVKCPVPAGNWKAMAFYLDPARRRGICDYLDPKAVDELIEVMYDQYYDHLKEYFGKVIKMSFYDEPSMHNAVSGRLWTAGFNEWFQKKRGYSPMKYYPALWYDIGPETAAARNALFGFRAELYAENFVGRIAAWCEKRGIAMSGHMDQEEPRNPVGTQGDLMKVFKHQHIPGIDDIWFTGRSNVSYKVIASAAYNYDRPLMMAETYAAYGQEYKTAKWVYRTAMDQHAMGANLQIGGRPGDTANKDMGQYVGRMEYLLRHG
ncbi:MAG: glycosyl hydrolase, partial [Phycisphaerales bacterium]